MKLPTSWQKPAPKYQQSPATILQLLWHGFDDRQEQLDLNFGRASGIWQKRDEAIRESHGSNWMLLSPTLSDSIPLPLFNFEQATATSTATFRPRNPQHERRYPSHSATVEHLARHRSTYSSTACALKRRERLFARLLVSFLGSYRQSYIHR